VLSRAATELGHCQRQGRPGSESVSDHLRSGLATVTHWQLREHSGLSANSDLDLQSGPGLMPVTVSEARAARAAAPGSPAHHDVHVGVCHSLLGPASQSVTVPLQGSWADGGP
jgi:hypothetical protein